MKVFEVTPGRWAYSSEGLYQEYNPDLEGFVPMTKEQAEYFSQRLPSHSEVISVTRAQAKLALLQFGRLSQIENLIQNIQDASFREVAKIEWNDRLTFESNNQVLRQLASALNIDNDELKAIFELAQTL